MPGMHRRRPAPSKRPRAPHRLRITGAAAFRSRSHLPVRTGERDVDTRNPTDPTGQRRSRVLEPADAIRTGYAFILPVLVLFVIFRIWPTINGFLLSFQDYRLTVTPPGWGSSTTDTCSRTISSGTACG